MHPSWRDLVIEHLRSNPTQRKRFLESCGLHGFLLALSQAGGEAGERHWPLLLDKTDWQTLTRSINRVICSKDQASWTILSHLIQLPAIQDKTNTSGNKKAFFDEMLREVLNQIRIRWDDSETPAIATLLAWFYKLTELIHPLPHGPNLDRIWSSYLDSAQIEIAEFDSTQQDVSVNETTDLFHLARILSQNEPRFIRQINFPACCIEMAKTLVEKISGRAALELDFEHSDECDSEQTLLWEMKELLKTLSKELEELADDASQALEILTENYDRVQDVMMSLKEEEERKEKADEAKIQQRQPNRSSSNVVEWAGTARWVDIKEVFSDL